MVAILNLSPTFQIVQEERRVFELEVEMRVESGNTGFVAELWGTIPNIVTAYLISPSGERSPVISIRQGSRYQLTFPFEQTVVDVEYQLFLRDGRSQLLFLKFDHPAQGIWKIGVQSLGRADGEFHIWLPVLLSLLLQFVCLCIPEVLYQQLPFYLPMLLVPAVNTVVCLILLETRV